MALTNPVNANIQGFQSVNVSNGRWIGRSLVAGTGISITNNDGTAGNPTITALDAGFAWSDKAVSFNAFAENGYFVTANATATLPASPSNGDTIKFFVDGAVTLTLQANTGQTIQFATNISSTAGTFVNTSSGDACELVYRTADTQWNCTQFVGAWNHT